MMGQHLFGRLEHGRIMGSPSLRMNMKTQVWSSFLKVEERETLSMLLYHATIHNTILTIPMLPQLWWPCGSITRLPVKTCEHVQSLVIAHFGKSPTSVKSETFWRVLPTAFLPWTKIPRSHLCQGTTASGSGVSSNSWCERDSLVKSREAGTPQNDLHLFASNDLTHFGGTLSSLNQTFPVPDQDSPKKNVIYSLKTWVQNLRDIPILPENVHI